MVSSFFNFRLLLLFYMYLDSKIVFFLYFCKNLYKKKYMLTVNNLSVQFGKRILFDEVNTTLQYYMELSDQRSWEIYIPQNNFW
jgi:hypothetical protein